MKDNNKTQMTFSIVEAVNALFDNESELKRYSWDSIDATAFFTAYITAGTYIFNRVTGGNKNNLEFTYLANQLVVQEMMTGKEEE